MTDGAFHNSLSGVPLFEALSPDHRERLARSASIRRLQAGEWLFHEGDPGDSLYVVTAGSLDAVAEGPAPVLVRRFGRGHCIGELALLTGEPRSLGARARRDSEVARIDREEFDALLLAEPAFGLALTRVLSGHLRRSRVPAGGAAAPPRIIGLVPLHDGAPVTAVADDLCAAFRRMGRLARIDPTEPLPPQTLDRIEATHDRVLLIATAAGGDDPWTAYCLRQSDLAIGLASRPHSWSVAPLPQPLRGCDLAFVATATALVPDLDGWMEALDPRTTHILRAGMSAGTARMARRLAGRALGVVLSGGGARGLAHIGVIEELQHAGYEIDRIGGVSIGGMVGSLFAEGRPGDECMSVMEAEYVKSTPLRGRTIPLVALSRGVKGFVAQHRLHGDRRIEGLDINFFCVSADLAAQRQVVHRRGLVAVAVSATQALPGFVPPVKDGDRILVDGAILDNLPVEPMISTGEGPVIAVDVSGALPPPRAPRSRVPMLRRWIVGPAVDWAPPIRETLLRSILLGNAATHALARERADAVIIPVLRGVSTMRFRDLEAVRRLGRDAARRALDDGLLDVCAAART